MQHFPADPHAHDPPCRACKRKGRGDVWHSLKSKVIWSESESESEDEGECNVPVAPPPKLPWWKRFIACMNDPSRPELLARRGAQGRSRGEVLS